RGSAAVRHRPGAFDRGPAPASRRPLGAVLPGRAGHVRAGLHQRPGPRPGRLGDHARGPDPVADRVRACRRRGMARPVRTPRGRCAMNRRIPVSILAAAVVLAACGSEPPPPNYGTDPELGEYDRGLLPSMVIANPAEWGDRMPV